MKFFQLTLKNDCQIDTNRSYKRFGYFLTFLFLFCLSANPFEAKAQHCGGATTTLAKWDFNSLNIQCNGAENLGPTPITNPSITPGATYCPNVNNGCSATTLGSVGHQNTPQFQNAICLANFYNVEAVLASGLGAPFDPSSTTFDPNGKVNLSVWYNLPKNTEGCLDNFQLKVLQKQFDGSQLNFETQGVAVKRNGVIIYTETQPITVANINGQPFTFNFSGTEFCSDGAEQVEFEIVFGLVHRLIGPAMPGTPGQTGYDDVCVSGSCKKNAFGGILPATCGATSPNDDAGVLIQNFAPGNRYDYNEGDSYTGSATYAAGSTEVPGDGIIPNFPNPATATDYSFRVFQEGCHSDFTVTLEPKYCCVIPTGGMLATTPATCDGTTANNDAQITLTGVSGGIKAGISEGANYSGPDFASANDLTGGEFTFTGLSNPLVAQTYTVRVYKDATCFMDLQTALFNETCIVPCTPPNGVTLTSTIATCAGTTKNTDAIIQVTNVNGGDRVGMSPSITYSGPDYDAASDLVNGSYTFTGINTPDGTQIYTVRVFNTSNGCYIDETIEIEDPECGPCRHPSAFVISVGENVGEDDGTNNQIAYESCQTPGFIDLELTKTVSATTATTYVSSGTPFDWTISIENKGNITATDVNVIDLIPSGLSVTANNPSKGTFYGGSGWEVGDLAANETATLTISTMALLNGMYTNCAYVNSALPENDPDSSPDNTEVGNEDDDDCAEITITGNNTPSIEQSFSPMLTSTDEPTRLTIKIRNNHDEPITLTNDLVNDFPSSPGQMTIAPTPNLYVSAGVRPGGSGITANPNGTELTIPTGTVLQPGLNEITVDLIAPVLGDYMVGIGVDELMTDIGGNFLPSEAMIKANPGFDMAPVVTVRMEPEIVIIGQPTNMVITIQNMNDTPMSLNQDFENEFPQGLMVDGPITSTGPTPFLQNNDTGINIPTGTVIAPNSTYTVTIPFTIDTPGTYTNIVNMNEVLTTTDSNNNNGNEDVAEATVRAVICPELTSLEAQESGTTLTNICSGETVDLKITHSTKPGNLAIYSSQDASLTAAQLYDFDNHATNGISVVNANVSPAAGATMTFESSLSPTDTITYYVILAEGHNLIIAPVCLPIQSVTVNVNPQTPTAALISGPVDVCSEDSRFVSGTENVVDLNSYISSGDVSGVWTTNAPAGALVGNIFTATQAMEGSTYTFTYTLAGNMPSSGTLCDDNVYTIDINVIDCYASLGDKVWEDKDGNGIQDENTSVEGVAVTLYACASGVKGAVIETLYTDVNGNYLFTELLPGEYCVKFDLSTATHPSVDDFKFTEQNSTVSGSDETNTSDADPTDGCTESYSLSAGDEELGVDAGVYIPAKLGDLVWEDINYNGVQDENEPGIENVTVTLTGTNGLGEPVGPIALQTTDVGMYMFGDLKPGEYTVTFEQPNGYVQTPTDDPNTNGDDESDSDANDNLQSPLTTIISGDTIPNVDAGFLVLGKIGDFAWQDYNADGIQDENEDPFENIELTLSGNDNMNNAVNVVVSTDANGKYCFTNVYPGTYIVTCGLPTDLVQTILEEPTADEEDDSDFNPTNNQTTPLVVVSKDTFLYVDAGFYGEDFGDAPNTFNTREAQDGPVHVIQPGKYLGTGVDAELNGKPQATAGYTGAGGDDNDPSNYEKGTNPTGDENGVNFITPMIPGHQACVEVTTTALSGNNYLTAWIDFSGNGNFESNEQLLWKDSGSTSADLLIANGAVTATYCFDVPADATFDGGETHSRFRLSCETGVQPTGRVIGGEVEDYYEAFAKIGNLVWRDYEFEGDQDEPTYEGFNGVEVQLVWEGLDGILGNADDVTYSTTTAQIDGENGKYCFFGAVPGDYTVKIPIIPAGFEPTQSDRTGDENNDSDGLAVDFTIAEDFNLPEGENGMTDNPTAHNYPDKQDNLQFDFGFIAFDYGDLPAGFPTKDADAQTGAHHSIIPCMYLGEGVDSEED